MEIFLKSSYHERWEDYGREFKHGRIQTIYGLGEEKGQCRKNGFDKERLKILLHEHGFVNIKVFSKKSAAVRGEDSIAICNKPRRKFSQRFFLESKEDTKDKKTNNLPRNYLRMLKSWCIYSLRYLADTTEEIK